MYFLNKIQKVSEELENANPVIDLEMEGTCPECDSVNHVRFSIVEFMNSILRRESEFLMREIHLLAKAYHWGFDCILSLTRKERREFVRMVLAERQGSMQKRRIA